MNYSDSDLEGRFAKCCENSNLEPSSRDLAFFEYRGPNSRDSIEMCGNCSYHQHAHVTNYTHTCTQYCQHCNNFVPHGPYDYDRFYCGHSGWD